MFIYNVLDSYRYSYFERILSRSKTNVINIIRNTKLTTITKLRREKKQLPEWVLGNSPIEYIDGKQEY